MSDSLWPRGLQYAKLLCPPLSPRTCSNSCPLSWWCYVIILFSATPFFFCLQSFPASGSFPVSWLFASNGQSFGASASASVLPMNIHGWFPLGLTGLISRDSKQSSPAQFKSINSLVLSLLYSPALTFVCDYWKNLSFGYTDPCLQSDVSAF